MSCVRCQVREQPECYVAREQLPALQQMSVQEQGAESGELRAVCCVM